MRNESERDKVLRLGRQSLKLLDKDQNWSWWLDVGEAIILLRQEAMDEAKTNKPEGGAYNRIFGKKLRDEKLDFDKGDRSRLMDVMDNRPAIEEWRAQLTATERRRLNHPSTVWRRWKAATTVPEKESQPSATTKLKDVNFDLTNEVDRLTKQLNDAQEHIKDLEASREIGQEALPKAVEVKCSFCGKDEDEVQVLMISAPKSNAFICDECVQVCVYQIEVKKAESQKQKAKRPRKTKDKEHLAK